MSAKYLYISWFRACGFIYIQEKCVLSLYVYMYLLAILSLGLSNNINSFIYLTAEIVQIHWYFFFFWRDYLIYDTYHNLNNKFSLISISCFHILFTSTFFIKKNINHLLYYYFCFPLSFLHIHRSQAPRRDMGMSLF